MHIVQLVLLSAAHALGAGTGCSLQRNLIPSLEISKGFLNVLPGKCKFDRCTSLCCPGVLIRLQQGPYPPLHCACRHLAQTTSPVEHGAVADDTPHIIQNPVVPLPTFWLGLLTCEFQCFKVAGQSIVWLGWELQGGVLTLLMVYHQPSCPLCMEGDDGHAMIRIMDQWHPKSNLSKVMNIPLSCQNVVWLGMMLSPHPLLMSRPLFIGRLHLAPPEGNFLRGVNKIYFI